MSARGRSAHAAAVLLLTASALVGGCGIRADSEPRGLAASEVPYGLLEEAPSTTTSTTTRAVPKTSVLVYFVLSDRVHPVPRDVTQPATVAKVLNALIAGPLDDEAVVGVRSAINPAASILPSRIDPSTFVVDLTAEFTQGSTAEQVLGLAQIVFTATELPGVLGVRFTLEGQPIEVPTPAGTLTSSPVNRDAFADLAPLPPELPGPSQ